MQLSSVREGKSEIKQESKQINWQQYNYPPLLKLMHFRPSELPDDQRILILMHFGVHIVVLFLTILNFIDNCIEATLGILYSALSFIIINPIIMFMFYRAFMGLLRDKSKLTLYTWIQPAVILLEIVISIIDFLGFNGFIKVAALFNNGQGLSGILALVVSIGWILIALLSAYLYFRIWKEKSFLAKALL